MKNFKKNSIVVIIMVVFVFGLTEAITAYAATTPSLGDAASYGVLGDTYTNPTGPTTINGDVGFTTGPLVAPLGVHTNYGSGAPYATAGTAQAAALADLNSQGCTFTFVAPAVVLDTTLEHGTTYGPGVYCSTGAMSVGTAGGITLSGAGTYIFRSGGALNMVTSATVNLGPGASACDVFWTPAGATTLNANSVFKGTVIPTAAPWDITVLDAVSWVGRALAFGHTITTPDANVTITAPTCSVPPTPPSSPSSGSGGVIFYLIPNINVTKIPSPLSLPGGPGSVTYTYVATNIGLAVMSNIWLKDDKCSPVIYVSGDSNNNSLLETNEAWTYTCTKTVSQTETNLVTAHGLSNGWDTYDNASATVVVKVPLVPPLIHLVKQASIYLLPVGGGPVTYSYTVTNPGTVPLSDVSIADDKCTGLPGRVFGHPGDLNKNDLLESTESWSFTCQSNIAQTTTNIGTATGHANGFTAIDYSPLTVVVSSGEVLGASTGFPNTGLPPEDTGTPWNIVIPAGIFLLAATTLFGILLKKKTA